MKPDINLVSFNGPFDDHRTWWQEGDLDGRGGTYADAVKCSTGLSGFKGYFNKVYGGYEDAVDVNNRCENITLRATEWHIDGCRMGFTVKGGSKNVTLGGCVCGHGKECDVDIGNASDQSDDWVTGTVLDLYQMDGSPIRVRVLGGDLPYETPGTGPYTYVFPSKPFALRFVAIWAYRLASRLCRRISGN